MVHPFIKVTRTHKQTNADNRTT